MGWTIYKRTDMPKLLRVAAIFILFSAMHFTAYAQLGQGSIKGKIIDESTKEPLPFAALVLMEGDIQKSSAVSDINGKYTFDAIPPGNYTIVVKTLGFHDKTITGVRVSGDKTTVLDMPMTSTQIEIPTVDIVEYKNDVFTRGDTKVGGLLDDKQIKSMPQRSAAAVAATIPGVFTDGTGGQSFRGGRTNANKTFIDGVPVRGSAALPQEAISEVEVVQSGVPANIGDLTGGATLITTKGASGAKFGTVEYLTSGFRTSGHQTVGLDNQAYNLLGITYGTPLLWKKDAEGKKERSLLSLLVASEFITMADPRPSIIGNYKANDEYLESVKQNPLQPTPLGEGSFRTAEFTRMSDLEMVDTRMNVNRHEANITANITVATTNNTDLRFGGNFSYIQANNEVRHTRYTGGRQSFGLFNYHNNPLRTDLTWRAYGRFIQRFGNPADAEESDATLIKNASVQFQLDYTKDKFWRESEAHGDDFFNYGHVGKFTTTQEETYSFGTRTINVNGEDRVVTGLYHDAWDITRYDFERAETNPVLANFTENYYNFYKDSEGNPIIEDRYDRIENVQQGGAVVNGGFPLSVYDMWSNPGVVANDYAKYDESQFRLSANGSANIGDHKIILGFEYEQRVQRSYSMAPVGLWTLGRQLTNEHITQIDTNSYTIETRDGTQYITYDRLYSEVGQSNFDRNLRESLGFEVDGTDFIDFDSYDPSVMKLEFFSADELLNGGNSLIGYNGYNHLGEKTTGRPSLDDFFTEKDENGNFKREIAAFEPIYMSGFIQDKFVFDDLVFRIGVRVDRFDANQPVLIDDFSFFPTVKAGESATGGNHPSNIGDDFVVYVTDGTDPRPENIVGYRDPEDDTWYDRNGVLVSNPENELGVGSSAVKPWLVDPENDNTDQMTSASFKDYEPQIAVMPRISFSFPISEQAQFHANYDILTSRPTSNLSFRPTDYLYLSTNNLRINNPDLKMEQTIQYEVGFKQRLSRNSALTISTFYREMRDQIQVIRKVGAYPVTYTTYDNIDFGTVKGLSLDYDFRQLGNVWMKANYTLQFAEGTGSNSTSQLNLVNADQPNLRVIQPLNFDRRHAFNLIFDYHYKKGKDYKGPTMGGKQILSNAGFNATFSGGSGTPYTRSSQIFSAYLNSQQGSSVVDGGINGARLPWAFNLDLRIDKGFDVKVENNSKGTQKNYRCTVYFQILNALNTQNIFGVHRSTGNPDDDGFLAAAEFQPFIQNQLDEESYRDLYQAKLLNDDFYAVQRRFRLGLLVNF